MAYEKRDAALAEWSKHLENLDRYDFGGDPESECERYKEAVREAFLAGWKARKIASYQPPK